MQLVPIYINDIRRKLIDVPCDGREYEVKIYIKTKPYEYEVMGTVIRTLMEHEKGKITGLTIGKS